jgi:hypothetical protein
MFLAAIDPNTGVITWTPSEAQGPSTNTFTTIASDTNAPAFNTKQYFITNSFSVVVNEVNNAPTLPAQTNRAVVPLTALTITNTAADLNAGLHSRGVVQ